MRVSAVSYLNTWPLVWGFLYGPERGKFNFRFDLPAQCAEALGSGAVDIGLVPCAELDRLQLDFWPDLGIASDGPVRSILLITKKPVREIRTLAADSSSRTSVALAQIILAERYGCTPDIRSLPPDLEPMLAECDAALIIGDPALRIDRHKLQMDSLDLGDEWTSWTSLPMVFAVWAGREKALREAQVAPFRSSYDFGISRIEEIVARAALERGFSEDLSRGYLTNNIQYLLGRRHLQGLDLFRSKVRELDLRRHSPQSLYKSS